MAGIRTDSIRGRGVKESRDRRDLKLHYWSWISDILKAPYRMRSILWLSSVTTFKILRNELYKNLLSLTFLRVRFGSIFDTTCQEGGIRTPPSLFPFTLLNHFLSCLSLTVIVMTVCTWSLDLEIRFLEGAHPTARLPSLKRLLIN